MVLLPPKVESFGSAFGKAIGAGLGKGVSEGLERKQEMAELLKENTQIEKDTGIKMPNILDKELRRAVFTEQLKGQTEQKKFAQKIKENQAIINDLEDKRGLERGSLSSYVNEPAMAERISRPEKPAKKTQASQPIDPEQLKILTEARQDPEFKNLDEVGKYEYLTGKGVSRENAETEAKITGEKLNRDTTVFDKSYAAHKDFIENTTKSNKAWLTDTKPKLLQLRSIPDENLIGPSASVFLEELGIPLGALDDPSSELYKKVSLDLLKGLPETYGNRILKVEVDNFLKTIPTLNNSPEGRRMIASNMLKLGEMKEIFYDEMRRQEKSFLSSGKPLPKDFEQEVFDQVKPQIERINNDFVQLSSVRDVPRGTVPFFDPQGEIKFVPEDQVGWAMENGGRRVW